MGAGVGTILGVFAGLTLFGASPEHGQALVRTMALGGFGAGGLVWAWERWQAREVKRASRRAGRPRRRGDRSDDWPVAGA
jgi:hypothetical protein